MNEGPEIEEVIGGESACYAHLLCLECGAVLDGHHRQPCHAPERHASDESDVTSPDTPTA